MLRKLIMYISAFLPMFLIMWLKELMLGIRNVLEKPCRYSWDSVYLNPYLIGILVFMVAISILTVSLLKRKKDTGIYTVSLKTVKNRSAEYYLAYYSLFILALIEFSLTDPIDLVVLVLLLFILGVVYIKNNLFFMNPTINIFQSYIYEVEYETNQTTITKLIISPIKLSEGNLIDIDISEFEFTFLRRKHEE